MHACCLLNFNSQPAASGPTSDKCLATEIKIFSIAAAAAAIAAATAAIFSVHGAINDQNPLLAVTSSLSAFLYSILIPLAVAWYLTLKCAAAFAVARVKAIQEAVAHCDPTNSTWNSDVVTPILGLITDVLPTMSNGWAEGSASVCLCCWSFAVGLICEGLSTLGNPDAFCDQIARQRGSFFCSLEYTILMAFFLSCLPLLVLYDLANTSTQCMALNKVLNDKRIANPEDETHLKIHKLEVMIAQHNYKQGLGFTIVGIVLSKSYFMTFFLRVGALASTALGTLLAFAKQQATTPCSPTANQIAIVANTFINESCSYNMTIDSLIRS
jgi:hypothetical protein